VIAPEAWVYLLRCGDGSLYTGWTSRYTASRQPVALELALPMDSRTAARREEARIKRLSRRGKLALLRERRRSTAT
jgi:putative endonuclease